MHIKSFKLFPIVLLIVALNIMMLGCGKHGSRFSNHAPTIKITSFEGYDPEIEYTDSILTSFQQKIFWHADDKDGIISGYAFRILDKDNKPMSTAGNYYIDSLGVVTPKSVFDKYGPGWVLHYKPGADQDISLNDPDSKKTIWTTKKYAVVNFIAANAAGLPLNTINYFEVICIDDRGMVCEKSAIRNFVSESKQPTCFISTTKGSPDSTGTSQVGSGIRLSFSMHDEDDFIQPTAWYYEFRIEKRNLSNNNLVSSNPANGGWFSTLNQTKKDEFLLTKMTTPSINSDYDANGTQVTYTEAVARVVDLAGVVSLPKSIKFAVKEGFHPRTLIYFSRVYAVGDNHNQDYIDPNALEVMPNTFVNNQALYATHFFNDVDNEKTVVYSNNLKIWVRWGWHGEYGTISDSGLETVTDNPFDRKLDKLYDDVDSTRNYFSEITHFDIRLNGEPYNYPPYAQSIQIDSLTNKRWLRVPVNSSLGQTIVLTHLPYNTPANPYHIFEVRAVDLQNEVDPTPAILKFKVAQPITKAQKQNILVIDDDLHSATASPSTTVDELWNGYFAGTGYTPDVLHYASMKGDFKSRKIALSDIQKYKLIFYHSENPSSISNIDFEHDAIALYLKQGGNIVVTTTGNGGQGINNLMMISARTMSNYFGLPYSLDAAHILANVFKPYFVTAVGQSVSNITYNNINVNLSGFNNTVNTRKGFFNVSYFPEFDIGTKVIYKFGCKPTNATVFPPSQEDYDFFNGLPVGLKKITANNKCYMLGFPLSYMIDTEAKDFVQKVINEVMPN